MSMYNDIAWRDKGNSKNVKIINERLRFMLEDFLAVNGHSWDLDQKRNGTEPILINQMENGTKLLKA